MLKCPFCQYENEDGALFCEQCKSDLSTAPATLHATMEAVVAALPAEGVAAEAVPIAEAAPPLPVAEPIVAAAPMASEAAVAVAMAETAPSSPVDTMAPTRGVAQVQTPPIAVPPPSQLPAGAQPKLVVLRGLKINAEYPLYEGHNFIGRADEKPVDIDLEDQEPPDRIWSSRQHALITYEDGQLFIEDLNSSNGTFVNRTRVYPGHRRALQVNDIIQIGTVQMKVKV
jgi:hypothetical protein